MDDIPDIPWLPDYVVRTADSEHDEDAPPPLQTGSNKPFRWTDLPAEIKNVIYDLALIEVDPFCIEFEVRLKGGMLNNHSLHAEQSGDSGNRFDFVDTVHRQDRFSYLADVDKPCYFEGMPQPPLGLGLLLVNKQMYAEAAPIFYSGNYFSFDSSVALTIFLGELGPNAKGWVRSVGVKTEGLEVDSEAAAGFDALVDVPNLEKLYVHCWDEGRFYKCAARWMRAVTEKSGGDKYAALQLLPCLTRENVERLKLLMDSCFTTSAVAWQYIV